MSDDFDPYFKWLAIPPDEQPPNHYRLLGVPLFLDDADVIEAAADQRMMLLRSYQGGARAALSQKLLNEVSNAKVCLLNAERKAEYDAQLRQRSDDESSTLEQTASHSTSIDTAASQQAQSGSTLVAEGYAWLGIPPEDWPPSDHQLLALHRDVYDRDAVEAAVKSRWKQLAPYLKASDARISSAAESILQEIKIAALNIRDEDVEDSALDTQESPRAAPASAKASEPAVVAAERGPVIQKRGGNPTHRLNGQRLKTKPLPVWATPVIGGIAVLVLVIILGSIMFSGNDRADEAKLNGTESVELGDEGLTASAARATDPKPIEHTFKSGVSLDEHDDFRKKGLEPSFNKIAEGNLTLLFMTGHHIVIPTLFLKEQSPLTVEAVVLPMGYSGHSTIFGNAQNSGIYLGLHDEFWAFAVRGIDNYKIVRSELPIVLYKRIHIAGVYDGESAQLYIDGKRQGDKLKIGSTITHSAHPFLIAADPNERGNAEHFFIGTIDTIRYSRGARYNNNFEVTRDLTLDMDTIALYRLERAYGKRVIDESENRFHGEIIGARLISRHDVPKPIMRKQQFTLSRQTPQRKIDLSIPKLYSPMASLEIGIEHMWDDEADGGMLSKLLGQDGTVLAEKFDTTRSLRWLRVQVQSPSKCQILLQDFDTSSNSLSVEAWISRSARRVDD